MRSKSQFASENLYDNAAVCLDCAHYHLIPRWEGVASQPWFDWLTKHPGHETFILPHKLLSRLAGRLLIPNANVKIAYAATASYTITLTGLATDANLLAGRESTSLSNTTNLYLDELVAPFITTGTSPTDAKQIEVHVVGALSDAGNWPDVFDGTESAETITTLGMKNSSCSPVAIIATTNTSNLTYPGRPTGIRQFFGDGMPPAHVMFVTHNTGVNLHATATNHGIFHTPIFSTVV